VFKQIPIHLKLNRYRTVLS